MSSKALYHSLFLLFYFVSVVSLPAQEVEQVIEGPVGDSYMPEHGPCLNPAQRLAINKRLEANVKELQLKGKLEIDTRQIVSFNWPLVQAVGFDYNAIYGISNYVDHNSNVPDLLEDYFCGTRTYDLASGYNHQGIDIFLWPFSWHMVNDDQAEVIAAAAGTIIGKDDGNVDSNCDFSNPNWNAVYVQHSDGSISWYGHLKNGSLTTKAVGLSVAQGEYLGISASSGSSTGPHLHFETYDNGGSLIDPYFSTGGCNGMNPSSWWANQKDYYDSQLNTILLHDAPPVFNVCPTPASRNIADCYEPGEQVYFAAYYHDQLAGQVSTYNVYRPNGSLFSNWTHSSSNAHYAASFWYWFTTLPLSAASGTWVFEVSFEGETISRNFTVASNCLLPIELSTFEVKNIGNKTALLSWQTAIEIDNLGFHIQRSIDGINWYSVGWEDGYGTSMATNSYEFKDSSPKSGVNYYRLLQEDLDGTTSVSEVRSLIFNSTVSDVRLYPNPVNEQLNLEVIGSEPLNGEIAIYNAGGELVYLAMPEHRVLAIGKLKPGVYFLETSIGKERIVKRFLRH